MATMMIQDQISSASKVTSRDEAIQRVNEMAALCRRFDVCKAEWHIGRDVWAASKGEPAIIK
eukprot:scaffold674_cov63-Cyclotella_meneghiniana.AAC.15